MRYVPFCYWRIMLLFFLFFLNRRIKFVPNVKLCLMILRSRKRNFVPRFIRHYYHLLMDCYRYLTRVTYKYIMTNAKDYRITQLMWFRCWIFLMCNFFKQLVWNISYIEFFAYMYIILIMPLEWMYDKYITNKSISIHDFYRFVWLKKKIKKKAISYFVIDKCNEKEKIVSKFNSIPIAN